METQFKGSERKHIPSKEVDFNRDVRQDANAADVRGEMELRKDKHKENKMPNKPGKAKK